jgi:ribonuclease I
MPTRRSREVMGDAKYCDAGQDQKRHCASYAALQTGACEMTAHGLWPSDTFDRLTAASFLGSANGRFPRPLPTRSIAATAVTALPALAGQGLTRIRLDVNKA